jgi:cytosine/adenosine deaminase-related metal-dependent hydrolase
MMSRTTAFRNASWLVAWDGHQHIYRCNADVVADGDTIVFVGEAYDGSADIEIDCSERLVLPGFVNIHAHPSTEPLRKGITDESRSPGFWHSSLYEFLPIFQNDPDGMIAALQVALAELLMSGVTTVVDLSIPFEGWLDTIAQSGIRGVVAPMFRDGRWSTSNGHELIYDWDEAAGRKSFTEACRLIDLANQHPCGRLSGMVCPAQIDTCSADLIRNAYAYAVERDLRFQIHAAQSINEFHEIFRRTGQTPIGWLDALGVLNDRTIIGHAIFLDHHPWLHWTTRQDLKRLSDSGTNVAHCPTVFMRRGIAMHTLGAYRRSGINVGIGTDTYPHNFLEEMRNALTVARAVAGTVDDLTTSDLYHASTDGGAHALGRPDLGKLSVGSKADLVVVDLKHPSMMPMREPLRSLIYVAAERAVRDVYVGGEQVVAEGRPVSIDYAAASESLERAQQRSMQRVPSRDWAGRSVDELAPMVLKPVPPTNDNLKHPKV